MTAYPATKYFAFIGIGGKSSMSLVFGKFIPNPTNIPNTAPDAPKTGTFAEKIEKRPCISFHIFHNKMKE